MAHILNHPLKALENENIIFYGKNDGHQYGIWCEFGTAIKPPSAA